MNTRFTTLLLVGSLFLLTIGAQAQTKFSIGTQVGLNVSNAVYLRDDFYHTRARTGFEAGLLGNVHPGHVTLQPALLFSQKGYHLSSGNDPNNSTGQQDDHFRLNYLTLSTKVLITPRQDGQGFQFFAGPYLSMLVGGHYERNYTLNATTTLTQGPIIPNQSPLRYEEYSSQRIDYGLLAGIGYRYKRIQLQVNYSWGLQELSVNYTFRGQQLNNPNYKNLAFQTSLAYLLPLN
ncbi:MAG: PorT family protein [Hymenobacter sp.]|nr:MAG: PorT family protein [Hymenobacter sp.]